jgi:hypothetical protein
MGIDAVAVLPSVVALRGTTVEGPWKTGEGPGGASGLWRELRDGILLNLGVPISSPDADLYDVAHRWIGDAPSRIWVFPDAAVPDDDTTQAIMEATKEVGRWVKAGPQRRTLLADLGFSPSEEAAWQREMNSGDAKRVAAAVAALEERQKGRDPAELEALQAKFLGKG